MLAAGQKIVNAENVRPYRAPGRNRQWRLVILAVALMAAVGAGAYLLLTPRASVYLLRSYDVQTVQLGTLAVTTQASGLVTYPVQMSVLSPEGGYAAELYVAEGQSVTVGQILARLEAPDLAVTGQDLEADLEDAQLSQDKLLLQNRISADRKRREIDTLAGQIARSEIERDEVRQLVLAGASPQKDFDTLQQGLEDLRLTAAEKQLQLREELEISALNETAGQAAVTSLETRIRRVGEQIAATTIRSPLTGEVLEVTAALTVPGSAISQNQVLFSIADPSSAIIELEVLEQHASSLTTGQQATVAVGGVRVTGVITSLGQVAQQSSDGLGATVVVKVRPQTIPDSMLVGSTAVGVLSLGVRENALILSRGPYLTTGGQRYLYRVEGDNATKVPVTFGTVEGNQVEVLAGVSAGDRVITSGYQNFMEYERIALGQEN